MICVMLAGHPAGQVSVCGKNFNVAIFWDTIDIINVKLCMVVAFIEVYPFASFSVTLIAFQGHSSIKQLLLKSVCSYLIKLKLCMITGYLK